VFFISLAGIPPLAGFFGKFYLFTSALADGRLLWLVVLAVAMNAVSLYYYLIVLKHAFVFPAPEGIRPANASASGFLVGALALAVLALGLAPDLLLAPLVKQNGKQHEAFRAPRAETHPPTLASSAILNSGH